MSTNRYERLPQSQADAQARRDLLSILRPLGPVRRGMFRRLHGVGFLTRAYATDYSDVCGRDTLTLWYGTPTSRRDDPDAPLAPYSVTTAHSFHIGRLSAATRATDLAGAPDRVRTCASGGGDDRGWIGASDADMAVAGAQTLAATLIALRQHRLQPDCGTNSDCTAKILVDDRQALLASVERCDTAAGHDCHTLTFDDSIELRVITTPSPQGVTVPAVVDSVSYAEFIVVT